VALLVETSLASGRDILRGIAQYVREHQPWSLYHEPRSLEESLPRWLHHWDGHGIIARLQNRRIVREVAAVGVPVVDVLGVAASDHIPLVHVNDAQIARLAAEHLLERGFRHFGYFGIAGENWSARRHEAFAIQVQQAGCRCQLYELPRHASAAGPFEMMEEDLARWVASLPKPAGVMVCSDQRGPQFLEACRRAGVAVPDEVAVVGVDNDEPLCEVCNPPLSSVCPGHAQVGYDAAQLLARLMSKAPAPDTPILVEPQGITTRLSTDVLAIEDRQLAHALRLIRENACAGIPVAEISRQAGLSRSVLQRRFRQTLKRTVHEEILLAKLKRARELLTETSLPLADIAEKTGFKHQEYLGAVFKKRLHLTPAQYRRKAGHQ
jgi:LacI family transcriptional regulator